MGDVVTEKLTPAEGRQARLHEQARAYFEPQLRRLNLAETQIEEQTLPQLEDSLEKINDLIAHPEGFGSLKLGMDGVSLLLSKADFSVQVGPLLLLLERKNQILRRIRALQLEQGLTAIKQEVTSARGLGESDDELMRHVEELLSERLEEERVIQRQILETDEAKQKALQFNLNLKRQQSEMYRAWFERESIASIVGAFLLLMLGISLVVAMFVNIGATEIVTSAFLLVLGYFFGQATDRRRAETAKAKSQK